jgi:hypothetical protein
MKSCEATEDTEINKKVLLILFCVFCGERFYCLGILSLFTSPRVPDTVR